MGQAGSALRVSFKQCQDTAPVRQDSRREQSLLFPKCLCLGPMHAREDDMGLNLSGEPHQSSALQGKFLLEKNKGVMGESSKVTGEKVKGEANLGSLSKHHYCGSRSKHSVHQNHSIKPL